VRAVRGLSYTITHKPDRRAKDHRGARDQSGDAGAGALITVPAGHRSRARRDGRWTPARCGSCGWRGHYTWRPCARISRRKGHQGHSHRGRGTLQAHRPLQARSLQPRGSGRSLGVHRAHLQQRGRRGLRSETCCRCRPATGTARIRTKVAGVARRRGSRRRRKATPASIAPAPARRPKLPVRRRGQQ